MGFRAVGRSVKDSVVFLVDDLLFSLPSRVTRADSGCWRTLRLTCELEVILMLVGCFEAS
jgi:hypothetical protein